MTSPTADASSLFAEFGADAQRRGIEAATAALLARIDTQNLDAVARTQLGELLLNSGFATTAIALLDRAAARFPQSIELRYWLGNALRSSGHDGAAEEELRGLLRQQPGHRDAAYSLAHMLREQGRTEAAAEVVATLWKSAQLDAESALAAINFLLECSSYPQALAIAHEAQCRWPQDARIAVRVGEIALAIGNFDEAAAALRNALDLDPAQSVAWLRLAYCRRYTDRDDADVARFRRGWVDATLQPAARTCAGFALGKALDDLDGYAEAINVLRRANASARATSGWRTQDWQSFVAARLAAEPLPALPAEADFVPVFIIGLPRTGTTMIAGALARRADVRNRGELNWVGALYAHLHDQGALRDPRALASAAAMIRAQMRRDDAPAQFYIDKNPLNFRYLDFIASLFPNAKIVHCRRGSRDTALSLWMQHFAHEDLGFAYDFSTIAEVEKGYLALMAYWRHTVPIEILDLDYEDFVAQPQAQQQRLAGFLGTAAADPGSSVDGRSDVITTASVWQVRQPVYTHAVERWRRYAPYLPELTSLFAE
jgi:tetratricopeptide (TPR) repeat protein